MTTATSNDLADFLGEKPRPAWQRAAVIASGVVGLLLLAVLIYRWVAPAPATSYATTAVRRGNLIVTVSATGKLAPTNQVSVGSELSGLVTKVLVNVNDRVIQGQPLALIDPSTFNDAVRQSQASLNASKAAVAQAQATLDQSRTVLDRYREVSRLSGGRVPAKTEMDQAIADNQRASANLQAARANVVSAEAQLSSNVTRQTKAVIRSPVNGVILARQIEPGQTVAASFNTPTLFVIAEDLSTMKLEVAIDEADVGRVKPGQDATFTVDAFPGRSFPARITRVDLGSNLTASSSSSSSSSTTSTSSSSSSQVVSYAAILSVANPGLELRPGMTATADITTASLGNALLISNAALRFRPTGQTASKSATSGGIAGAIVPSGPPGGTQARSSNAANLSHGGSQTVYVLGADGAPRAVSVAIGQSDGSMTQVTAGVLKAGDTVITGQLATGAGQAKAG